MLRLDDQGREIDEFGNVVVQPEMKPTSSLKVSAGYYLLGTHPWAQRCMNGVQALMV